jgi:very-short-patch-repair endonuclease
MVDQKHKPKWHVSEKQHSNARAGRHATTGAKRIISDHLRAQRFQVASLRTQTPVAYVVHFVCHAAKSIVKREGGQQVESTAIVHDVRRDADLRAQGCGIVRFDDLDIMKNKAGALEEIAVALGGSQTPSPTLPRKPGRGPGHACREDVP